MSVDATRHAPDEPGIYRLYLQVDGGDLKLLYVGRTTSLRERLRGHEKPGWDTFTFEVIHDAEVRRQIEQELIREFDPPLNQDIPGESPDPDTDPTLSVDDFDHPAVTILSILEKADGYVSASYISDETGGLKERAVRKTLEQLQQQVNIDVEHHGVTAKYRLEETIDGLDEVERDRGIGGKS